VFGGQNSCRFLTAAAGPAHGYDKLIQRVSAAPGKVDQVRNGDIHGTGHVASCKLLGGARID
jgi:hypothetical protein